jgi:hypothetical protein
MPQCAHTTVRAVGARAGPLPIATDRQMAAPCIGFKASGLPMAARLSEPWARASALLRRSRIGQNLLPLLRRVMVLSISPLSDTVDCAVDGGCQCEIVWDFAWARFQKPCRIFAASNTSP